MFTNQRAAETDGDFTTIFGAYVYNWYTGQEDRSIYTVDCRVSYGWVSITQVESNPPEVLRSSFEVVGKDELPRSAGYLPCIYGGAYGANGEKIVKYPIGTALVTWTKGNRTWANSRTAHRACMVYGQYLRVREVNRQNRPLHHHRDQSEQIRLQQTRTLHPYSSVPGFPA
ncbi:hypothetical protein GTR04_5997 [Trichophyton interdigitale]|nr:hypothetical protein GY631_5848 [Trichophyton interdigitale]KAG5218220.1 hypothetical protein GY632_5775 [Trichophyton interdigitale]KAG8206629.1 hypothetical protein GTR04_5997 [Trichophyton interdigitale]